VPGLDDAELDPEPVSRVAEQAGVALHVLHFGTVRSLVLGQPVNDVGHPLQGRFAGLGHSVSTFIGVDAAEVESLVCGDAQVKP
jgi:hypothetical protein